LFVGEVGADETMFSKQLKHGRRFINNITLQKIFVESLNDQSGIRLGFMLHCLAMHVCAGNSGVVTLNQIFIRVFSKFWQ